MEQADDSSSREASTCSELLESSKMIKAHQRMIKNKKDIIYLANLDYQIDEVKLMTFISSLGLNPRRAKVLIDSSSGHSKGSAFVQMQTAQDATQATKLLSKQEFRGREMFVRLADDNVY